MQSRQALTTLLGQRDLRLNREADSENDLDDAPFASALKDRRPSWMTYETYYGLREKPFALSSEPRFFYQSRGHASAYDDLRASILRRESLSVLIGDIGTGKTTLCRTVLRNLDRKTFCAYVPDPFASREDLLKVVLMDFGVVSVDDLTTGRLRDASRTELSYLLYKFLDTLAPLQAFAVVVIDEAQNLSIPLLEEIRILSDSDGRKRQLQVVLVGQLELHAKLKLPEMRQVDQRIAVRCGLEPLNRSGVEGYVGHRLQVAGGSPDRIMFSPEALDAVYQLSNGVPRLVNRLCDRALHHAHRLRAAVVDPQILADAACCLRFPQSLGATEQEPSQAPSYRDLVSSASLDTTADEWVITLDEESSDASDQTAEDATGVISDLPSPEVSPYHHVHFPPHVRPLTHLQRVALRWQRRLGKVAGWGIVLGAVTIGVSQVVALTAAVTAPIALPAFPSSPTLPTFAVNASTPPEILPSVAPLAGTYVIEVALFETPQRANRLVEELTRMGYRAYGARRDFGTRGSLEQVLIGLYVTREEASSDLEELQKTDGYEDARIAVAPHSPDRAPTLISSSSERLSAGIPF
jgi:type II secretory pathway predicted ATPase ExeA/cell division septation protein DedD